MTDQPLHDAQDVPECRERPSVTFDTQLNEIRKIAKSHLERTGFLQGTQRTEMLRRVNHALDKSLSNVTELISMIQHFRGSSDNIFPHADHPQALLQNIVNRVLRAMQYTFPLNKITVLKIIPRDLCAIRVPPEHLETIVFNLIYFARHEIGQEPGIITIEASEKTKESLEDSHQRYHDVKVSYLSRTRILQSRANLFDPFFEAEGEDHLVRFGLFVAKKLIEHHSGVIFVKGTANNTSFVVEFPTN